MTCSNPHDMFCTWFLGKISSVASETKSQRALAPTQATLRLFILSCSIRGDSRCPQGGTTSPSAILSNGIELRRNFQVSPNLNQPKSMTHWIPSCRRLLLHMLFALGRRAVRFMWLMSDHLEGDFFSLFFFSYFPCLTFLHRITLSRLGHERPQTSWDGAGAVAPGRFVPMTSRQRSDILF